MAAYPAIFDASQAELKELLRSLLELDKKSEARNLLYSHYSLSLRNAVSAVFLSPNFDNPTFDLYQQLLANVSRFSAFKAQHVLDELLDIPPDKDPSLHISDVINKFNRYQAAEYNAATARARSAKQWADWDNDPILSELYPNIRWLPSRSANPRPEHQAFYGLVLPRNDPFWQHNQPGNLWNCKCDWEPTDSNTSRASISKADLNKARRHSSAEKGLEGNPAASGHIFSNKASYFHNATKAQSKAADSFFYPIAEHHEQYVSLLKDQDYTDQHFNWDNGGLKATHKDHNFDMVGGEYELHVVEAAFSSGVAVILAKEVGPTLNFRFVEGTWNGASFEVAGRETATANNVLRGLKHCASKRTTKIAVLDYPNGGFDETILLRAIDRYKGLKKLNDGQYVPFEKIICVQNKKIIYEVSL